MSMNTHEIRQEMPVVSSDGERLGTVARVDGERIELAITGHREAGEAPYVTVDKVEIVEADGVHLLTSARAAVADRKPA